MQIPANSFVNLTQLHNLNTSAVTTAGSTHYHAVDQAPSSSQHSHKLPLEDSMLTQQWTEKRFKDEARAAAWPLAPQELMLTLYAQLSFPQLGHAVAAAAAAVDGRAGFGVAGLPATSGMLHEHCCRINLHTPICCVLPALMRSQAPCTSFAVLQDQRQQ